MRRERHNRFGSRWNATSGRVCSRARGQTAPGGRHPPSGSRAFTLLELLIATAVGAVVLLVIQTTYFGALRLHNTTHDRIEQDLTMQRALAIVRRDFAGLLLPGGTLSGQFQTDNFSSVGGETHGERIGPDMFTSSGRIDGYNPFSEVQRVAFYLAQGSTAEGANRDAKNFVRVITRNLLPVQEADSGEEQVLLEGVLSASITFYDGTAWTDTWDSEATSTLPRALKLSLVMAPPSGSQSASAPIELVVPVLVRTTTSEREDEEAANPP
jgi:type II secretion system protein J